MVVADYDFLPTKQFAIVLISIGTSVRIDARKAHRNDRKAGNGIAFYLISSLGFYVVANQPVFHRYCSVSDWIQFEETEGSEEKRLNWFETQAKEKSEKDGERNGEESTPYVFFKLIF